MFIYTSNRDSKKRARYKCFQNSSHKLGNSGERNALFNISFLVVDQKTKTLGLQIYNQNDEKEGQHPHLRLCNESTNDWFY